jgi:hypothetical protein
MGNVQRKEGGQHDGDDARRRLELSLILEFGAEEYRDDDGEVNEDLMCREALNYAAEAAKHEFDVEISRVSGDNP